MLGECVRACEASTAADRATVLRVFRISVDEPEAGFGFPDLASQKSMPRFQIQVHPWADRFGNRPSHSKNVSLAFQRSFLRLQAMLYPKERRSWNRLASPEKSNPEGGACQSVVGVYINVGNDLISMMKGFVTANGGSIFRGSC